MTCNTLDFLSPEVRQVSLTRYYNAINDLGYTCSHSKSLRTIEVTPPLIEDENPRRAAQLQTIKVPLEVRKDALQIVDCIDSTVLVCHWLEYNQFELFELFD